MGFVPSIFSLGLGATTIFNGDRETWPGRGGGLWVVGEQVGGCQGCHGGFLAVWGGRKQVMGGLGWFWLILGRLQIYFRASAVFYLS